MRRILGLLVWLLALPVLVVLLLAPFATPVVAVKDKVVDWWYSPSAALAVPQLPQRSTILDSDGNFLAELYLYNREVVAGTAISPHIKEAVVAVEDRRFYEHPGVDVEGLGRALIANVRTGSMSQGGSGITQQYVKNLLALQDLNGDPGEQWEKATERSLDRKFREARMAMGLETRMSKEDILTGYLNTASFGNGTYGVEAASRFYFDKSAADVTLGEAAILAGLLKSPTIYDPLRNPQNALKRRAIVLATMTDQGLITAAEQDQAASEPLPVGGHQPPGRCGQSYAPFYCGWVTEQLLVSPLLGATPEERRQRLALGGLVIRTGLSRDVQKAADTAMRQVPATSRVASAIAMVEPGTGVVRALATSREWGVHPKKGQTELLLPTLNAFQTGSTFKAFTVATALDQGLDPDLRLPAGTTYKSKKFLNPEKGYFSNYSSTPWRNLTIRDATTWSVNTAFIQLQEKIGTRTLAKTAKALGIANLPVDGPDRIRENEGSLTLGARETSVMNVANGYASIAAGGLSCPATGIVAIQTRNGQNVGSVDPRAVCKQVISPAAAAMTTDVLRSVVTDGTGKNAALGKRPIAGKTGTTNNSAAVWFAGFTPQLAAAVWIGDPRGPKYSVDGALGYASMTGGSLPAMLWKSAMRDALQGQPIIELPGATRLSVLGGATGKAAQRAGMQASPASPSPAATATPAPAPADPSPAGPAAEPTSEPDPAATSTPAPLLPSPAKGKKR